MPDVSKGSYYNNPTMDKPTDDAELIENYPQLCCENIWPDDTLKEFKPAFKAMGQRVVDIGLMVAKHVAGSFARNLKKKSLTFYRHCDKFAASELGDKYAPNTIHDVIKKSNAIKARLLHYFPFENAENPARDSWCGWHNDSDVLTGLVPAMYITDDGTISQNPDPNAGLWIKTRSDKEVKVSAGSKNALLFQIGEIAQVLTGGLLRATPHAVQAIKSPESKMLGRDTFAVFMQPHVNFVIKPPKDADLKKMEVGQYKLDMTAGEFQRATLKYYYERK